MKQGTVKSGGLSPSKITTSSDGDNVTITIPKSALTKYSGVDGTESDSSSNKTGYLMLAGMGLILIGVVYYGTKLVKG
jgi:hypothetical protein